MATFLRLVDGQIKEISALSASEGEADANKVVATGDSGRLDLSVLPEGVDGGRITASATEDLAAGALINLVDDAGSVTARNADATAKGTEAQGFVTAAVAAGNAATVYTDGLNAALSGLTPGARYYLATTPGQIDTSAPAAAGNVTQYIGYAGSPTVLVFASGAPVTRVLAINRPLILQNGRLREAEQIDADTLAGAAPATYHDARALTNTAPRDVLPRALNNQYGAAEQRFWNVIQTTTDAGWTKACVVDDQYNLRWAVTLIGTAASDTNAANDTNQTTVLIHNTSGQITARAYVKNPAAQFDEIRLHNQNAGDYPDEDVPGGIALWVKSGGFTDLNGCLIGTGAYQLFSETHQSLNNPPPGITVAQVADWNGDNHGKNSGLIATDSGHADQADQANNAGTVGGYQAGAFTKHAGVSIADAGSTIPDNRFIRGGGSGGQNFPGQTAYGPGLDLYRADGDGKQARLLLFTASRSPFEFYFGSGGTFAQVYHSQNLFAGVYDKSADRSQNVTYTNTTGRPIFVTIDGGTDLKLIVDSARIKNAQASAGGTDDDAIVSCIVPPGSTYKLTEGGFDHWTEVY